MDKAFRHLNGKHFSMIGALFIKNRGIGINNTLPWTGFKRDMEFFKDTTLNNVVIMGFNTYKSLNRNGGLQKRSNIVVNKNACEMDNKDGVIHCNNFESGLEYAHIINNDAKQVLGSKEKKEIFVIGGQKIYEKAINHMGCIKLYLTEVELYGDMDIKCDAFFPDYTGMFYVQRTIEEGITVISVGGVKTKVKYSIKEYCKRHWAFLFTDE